MTEYRIELLFDKNVPPEIDKKVNRELIELDVYRINTADFIIMRTKLIYIPVVMATIVYGPPKVEHRKPPWLSFAQRLYEESEIYFAPAFTWCWSDDDQKAYDTLSSRVKVRIEASRCESVSRKHVFWPVTVFDLKEVKEEVERIRRSALFSPDDPHDRVLINVFTKYTDLERAARKKYGEELEGKGDEEMIKYLVMVGDESLRERMLKLHDVLRKVRDQVKSVFWFSSYYPG